MTTHDHTVQKKKPTNLLEKFGWEKLDHPPRFLTWRLPTSIFLGGKRMVTDEAKETVKGKVVPVLN
jgi:hypothetical protein